MMARNRLTVNFDGFEALFEKLDRLGADMKDITEEALRKSFDEVTPGIRQAMQRHHDTGDTERSLTTQCRIEWDGSKASVPVGFKISDGGLPSIFLMYGTPRHPVSNQYGRTGAEEDGVEEDRRLYNSIYGSATKRKVKQVQEEVFQRHLREVEGR